jgi:hypothetical protein
MPIDPRETPEVRKLAEELSALEYSALLKRIRKVNDDDMLGWVRFRFEHQANGAKPWQVIVINRWLERDKFFRNILPQWIGIVLAVFSLAVSVLALVIASKAGT